MTLIQTRAPTTVSGGAFARAGRLAGAAWFLLLGALRAGAIPAALKDVPIGNVAFGQWAPILSSVCTATFFMILGWLMLARGETVAQDTRLVPRIVALVGTYGVWAVSLLPQSRLSPGLDAAAAAVTLVGSVLVIYTVTHLGRSFSISPQARTLVTRGPYALVRNPLYLAEEIAFLGLAMHVVWWLAAPFLVVHIALQVQRILYEERLLGAALPEYAAYAGKTARLIPGLW